VVAAVGAGWWARNGAQVEAVAVAAMAVAVVWFVLAAYRLLGDRLPAPDAIEGSVARQQSRADRHDEPIAAGFGGTIRLARLERGLSQGQLAQLLGVTQPSVSAWEQGKAFPAVATLAALARLLGLDAADLLDMA
jgi:DNA-binding XRE family transcriptional regulator